VIDAKDAMALADNVIFAVRWQAMPAKWCNPTTDSAPGGNGPVLCYCA